MDDQWAPTASQVKLGENDLPSILFVIGFGKEHTRNVQVNLRFPVMIANS
jgi:hypothetical protein